MNELSLSTIKSIIRGCVVSTPGQQLTIFELNREYRNQEGINIPHQHLGFNSVLAFLQSIPDTIHVSGTDRFSAIVRVVSSEKTAHVESLVARTTPSSSRRRRSSSRHASCPPARRRVTSYMPPRMLPKYPTRSSASPLQRSLGHQALGDNRQAVADVRGALANHQQMPAQTSRALSPMPESVEQVFVSPWLTKDIVDTAKKKPGLTLKELEEGIDALGRIRVAKIYTNIETLIGNMTETFVVKQNRVYFRDPEAHGLPPQPPTPPRNFNMMPAGEEAGAFGSDQYDDFMEGDMYYDDVRPVSNAVRNSLTNSVTKNLSAGAGAALFPDDADHSDDEKPAHRSISCSSQEKERSSSLMSKLMKERICDLLQKNPSGIWCSQLADLYKSTYFTELNFLELKYVSIVQMLKTVPELFSLKQIDGSDWMLFDVSKGVPASFMSAEPFITESTLKRIVELLSTKSNGIHIDEFPAAYENIFSEKFDYTEMNYVSLDALFLELEELLWLQVRPAGDRFRLYPMIPIPDELQPSPLEQARRIDQSIRMLFPDEVVGPDYKFPELELPPEVQTGADIEVLVEAVISVDQFYVQLRDRHYSKACEEVSDAMFEFYQHEAGKYRVPTRALVVGLYCVTFLNDEYHRLKIIRINATTVTARLIDFGNREEVNKKAVYFMHKKFAVVPAQAILCRCANLRPPSDRDRFSVDAGKRFLSLVMDKGIVATIAQFFPSVRPTRDTSFQPYWMWLSLVDTTGNEDFHINDQLVNEGFAVFHKDQMTPALLHLAGIGDEKFLEIVNSHNTRTEDPVEVPRPEPTRLVMKRRSAPVVPSIDELQESYARAMEDTVEPVPDMLATVTKVPGSPVRAITVPVAVSPLLAAVAPEPAAVAPVRPPPGFKPLPGALLPARSDAIEEASRYYPSFSQLELNGPLSKLKSAVLPNLTELKIEANPFIPRNHKADVEVKKPPPTAPLNVESSSFVPRQPRLAENVLASSSVDPQEGMAVTKSFDVTAVEAKFIRQPVKVPLDVRAHTGTPLQAGHHGPSKLRLYTPPASPQTPPIFPHPHPSQFAPLIRPFVPHPPHAMPSHAMPSHAMSPPCYQYGPHPYFQPYNPFGQPNRPMLRPHPNPYFHPQEQYRQMPLPYPSVPFYLTPADPRFVPQPHSFNFNQQAAFKTNQDLTNLWDENCGRTRKVAESKPPVETACSGSQTQASSLENGSTANQELKSLQNENVDNTCQVAESKLEVETACSESQTQASQPQSGREEEIEVTVVDGGNNLTDEAKEGMLTPDTSLELEPSAESSIDETADDATDKSCDRNSREDAESDDPHGKVMQDDEETEICDEANGNDESSDEACVDVVLTYTCEDDLPTIAGSESEGTESPVEEQEKHITTIGLGGQELQLFNIDGELFMEVKEVIGLTDLKTTVALKILKSKEMNRKFHELKKKTHGHIFDELAEINMNNGVKSFNVVSVQLVPLQSVHEMLAAVNVKEHFLKEIEMQLKGYSLNI